MTFNKEISTYGERDVYYLLDDPENPLFPGKTVFLDAKTSDLVAIPDNLSPEATANVYHTGQYSLLMNAKLQVSGYTLATDAINACNDGVLVIEDFYQGWCLEHNGLMDGCNTGMNLGVGADGDHENHRNSMEAVHDLLSAISEETGTTFKGENHLGTSMGDAPALWSYAHSENRGILCITGCAEKHQKNAMISDEDYASMAGETAFVSESVHDATNRLTYTDKLVENGVNVYIFPDSNAHGAATKKFFNNQIFDALGGDKEKLEQLYESYAKAGGVQKIVVNENGEKVSVPVEFDELYKEVLLNKVDDKDLVATLRTLPDKAVIDIITTQLLPKEENDDNTRLNPVNFKETIEELEKDGRLATLLARNDDDILYQYIAIEDTANDMMGIINGSLLNNGIKNQTFGSTTIGFPNLVNSANSVLFSASSILNGIITNDAANIETILNNFVYLDNKYASAVSTVNLDFTDSGYTQGEVSINATSGGNTGIKSDFSVDTLEQGKAGKISMSDIDSILSGNTLVGPVADGLQNEYDEAAALKNSINNMLNLPQNIIKGDIWDAERERLQMLSDCCDLRMQASKTLESAYVRASKLVKDYIGSDSYLDDGEIPQYEAALRAAKAVPPIRGTGTFMYLEDGTKVELTEPNEPEYSEAQAQIPILEAMISKLEGLASIMNQANQIISDAVAEVNASYASVVKDIPNINVPNITITL